MLVNWHEDFQIFTDQSKISASSRLREIKEVTMSLSNKSQRKIRKVRYSLSE